jgi:FkbM family methyltransferase
MSTMALRNSVRRTKHAVRTWMGKEVYRCVQIQCGTLLLGNDGAQWCIRPEGLHASSIVYSCGVGEDVSFDLELIREYGASVHAFDPTPRSIQWVEARELPAEFVLHKFGIADRNGTIKFLPPLNPNHVSYSIVERETQGAAIEVPVHRLRTIMDMLKHTKIDLLKMDIEGAEYGVIQDLLQCGIAIDQLLVEFHHRWPNVGIAKTERAIRMLNDAGYRIFYVSPTGEEYSFVRF